MAAGHGWGGASRRGFQPPRVGSRHVKASQAFTPFLIQGECFLRLMSLCIAGRSGVLEVAHHLNTSLSFFYTSQQRVPIGLLKLQRQFNPWHCALNLDNPTSCIHT